MNESKHTTKVINYLKNNLDDYVYIFKHVQAGYSQIGVPDVLACYKNKFIGIEVKMYGNTCSRNQSYNLHRIKKSGGIALVLYINDKYNKNQYCLTDVTDGSVPKNLVWGNLPSVIPSLESYIKN